MTATAARAALIREPFRRATSTTTAVQTRHGALARESADPVPTFFDNVADAQVIADARQALFSSERRLFEVAVRGTAEMAALDPEAGVPVGRFVDSERGVDRKVLIGQIEIDLAGGKSAAVIWG
jgi:hypothetical protein